MTDRLIDESALVRLGSSPDVDGCASRIERGAGPDHNRHITPAIEDRAVEVLTLILDQGQHRAPSVPDLISASTAELTGPAGLLCDKDFDLIASVTGQPAECCTWPDAAPGSCSAPAARTS